MLKFFFANKNVCTKKDPATQQQLNFVYTYSLGVVVVRETVVCWLWWECRHQPCWVVGWDKLVRVHTVYVRVYDLCIRKCPFLGRSFWKRRRKNEALVFAM